MSNLLMSLFVLSILTKHQHVKSFVAPKLSNYGSSLRTTNSIGNRVSQKRDLKKSMSALFSTASPSTEELEKSIKIKGDEIRALKSDGISKEDLKPHIDELLSLKDKLASLSPPSETPEKPKAKAPKKKQPQKQQKKKIEEEEDPDKIRLDRIKKLELMNE